MLLSSAVGVSEVVFLTYNGVVMDESCILTGAKDANRLGRSFKLVINVEMLKVWMQIEPPSLNERPANHRYRRWWVFEIGDICSNHLKMRIFAGERF